MTVLFSELQVPGWADSGEKMGLKDVTFSYDNAKAFTLPCHVADPELFYSETDQGIAEAKALCRSCPVRISVSMVRYRAESHAVFGAANLLKMA